MMIEIGSSVGPYEIRSQLGSGGMGEVYLAQDSRLGRAVALKVLPEDMASDPQRMRRFIQEAKTTSALNHPNLLTIYEIGQEGSINFIATEFVDGETLRKHLANREFALEEILRVGIQVAEALAAAHEAGVVHRDIKPENIMLRRRDRIVKVLDFGLAKLTDQFADRRFTNSNASSSTMLHTAPHVVLGTGRYMSPEQARGLPVDARTDIWSLGVVLYEMTAGVPPFTGETASDLIVSILDRDPGRLPDHIPAEMHRIVKKALSKDREKRYQAVKDLALDLENLRWELEISAEHQRVYSSGLTRANISADTARSVRDTDTPEAVQRTSADSGTQLIGKAQLKQQQTSKFIVAAFSAVIITIAVILYFQFWRSSTPTIDSIAVLPFANASSDAETDYLADGITDSLTESVSQLPNMAVIARSSVFRYKGREIDPQAVGRELHVRAVLTGRIVQRGDDLTISAELVDVSNNRRLWGERYERKLADILSVQTTISKEISDNLRLTLSGEEQKRVTKQYTSNIQAYQAYLKGRYYWNKRNGDDLKKSIQYYHQAISYDPNYALSYAGLADTYLIIPNYSDIPIKDAYVKAKEAATKALQLDDTLAEAHASLGGIKVDYEWDFVGAEKELKRAIELNPNYATGHHWYAQYLSEMGRHDEAISEIKRALELDPLSLIINSVLGDTYIKARQYDKAIAQLRKTIEMDKNFIRSHQYLANAYIEKGMYELAISENQTAATLRGQNPETVGQKSAGLRAAYAEKGPKGYWEKQLEAAKEREKLGSESPYELASIYARLDNREETFKWLEKAFQERDPYLIYLKIDPQFDTLRTDQRALDLMRRIGLIN